MNDYYLFLSGKPYGELYHWEKILFVSEQAAIDYLDNFQISTFGTAEERAQLEEEGISPRSAGLMEYDDWFWGPTIIPISLSDNDTAWPTTWDGHQTVPVEVVR